MRQNSPLFSSIQCGPMAIPNRFMRSATWEGLSDDKTGMPSKKLLKEMVNLAKGGTGLIVPGYVYPIKSGKAAPFQTGMYTKEHAEAWRETINEIHKYGSKVVFQIAHGGDRALPGENGEQPAGCSGLLPGTRAMTEAEINDTIQAFITASKNLKEVGADGVQIHAAHGYLVSQFLSPALNKRTDKWGELTENRVRILFEMINGIRNATHDSIAVGVKINGNDFLEGGVDPQMCIENISLLPPLDFAEISCGALNRPYTTRYDVNEKDYIKNVGKEKGAELTKRALELMDGIPYTEGYNVEAAAQVKEAFPELPVASVGGWRTFSKMEFAINTLKADIISMSRPFLKDPSVVKHLLEGEEVVRCNNCGLCSLHRVDIAKNGIKCQNWKQ